MDHNNDRGAPASSQGLSSSKLLPQVYGQLRKLAAVQLRKERAGQTLQATALVHEAYLRVVNGNVRRHWANSAQFLGVLAEVMRRILIEKARHKKRLKWGGSLERLDLDPAALSQEGP